MSKTQSGFAVFFLVLICSLMKDLVHLPIFNPEIFLAIAGGIAIGVTTRFN